MTDRHAAYIVVLDHDIREDEAEATITALRMVRGVASVEPVTAEPYAERIARTRRDLLWRSELAALTRRIVDERERP